MSLRNNLILKAFAILLFCFELLAPAFLSTTEEHSITENNSKITLIQSTLTLSSFLLEERNEEEREGKDSFIVNIDFYDSKWFSFPKQVTSSSISFFSPSECFNTHPPLFQLNCSMLI
jgi:hypothetical protein